MLTFSASALATLHKHQLVWCKFDILAILKDLNIVQEKSKEKGLIGCFRLLNQTGQSEGLFVSTRAVEKIHAIGTALFTVFHLV